MYLLVSDLSTRTRNKIAAEIANTFDEFQIITKVTSCVTDNASNMVKALKLLDSACNSMPTADGADAESSDSEQVEGTEDVELISLTDILRDKTCGDECEILDMLRKHIRCANHTLNLVADIDCKSARSDEKYKRIYVRVMAKVQALSHAVNRSTKHADVVEKIVGLTFLNPTCTWWSSEYMAVNRIITVGLEKVHYCQQRIGLACITEAEMTFLKSYVHVMKPVSIAMDLLQSEQECCIGHVIPTIMGIQQKLKRMTVDPALNPLVTALSNGLATRFKDMFDDDSYHIATMLIPKFKLRYLPEKDRQFKKLILTQAVCKLDREKQAVMPEAASTPIRPAMQPELPDIPDTDDDLFAFISADTSLPSASNESVVDEVDRYLANADVTVTSLLNYPHLVEAFLKYNSPLPSSAAVERLFSCAGQILVQRRCKVSDTMFQKLVFLRYKLKH